LSFECIISSHFSNWKSTKSYIKNSQHLQ
jgi:hypothetical protein